MLLSGFLLISAAIFFMNVKIIFFAVALLLDAASLCAEDKSNTVPTGQIAATVGRLLEEGHYSRWKLGR